MTDSNSNKEKIQLKDMETSVSLLEQEKTVQPKKKIPFKQTLTKIFIGVLLCTFLFSLTVTLLVCFADITKELRCSIADSWDMHLEQCGTKGTLGK